MIQALVPASVLNCRMSLPFDLSCTRPRPRLSADACRVAVLLLCLAQTGCAVLGTSDSSAGPLIEPAQSTPVPAYTPAPAAKPAVPSPTTPEPVPTAAPSAPVEAATPADAAARRLLAFNERVRDFGLAELARESVRLGEAADPATALELALVLAQTRQIGDLARALALVEPLARPTVGHSQGNAPWLGLARLLHVRLLEQRRLEEQTERLTQQTREMQRRIDQLSSQIDALRAIERSLNARPAGMPPAAPAPANPPR